MQGDTVEDMELSCTRNKKTWKTSTLSPFYSCSYNFNTPLNYWNSMGNWYEKGYDIKANLSARCIITVQHGNLLNSWKSTNLPLKKRYLSICI